MSSAFVDKVRFVGRWVIRLAIYGVVVQVFGAMSLPLVVQLGLNTHSASSPAAEMMRWTVIISCLATPLLLMWIFARIRRRARHNGGK